MQLGLHESFGRGFESRRAWQQERSSAAEQTKRASALSQHLLSAFLSFQLSPSITERALTKTPANAAWEYIVTSGFKSHPASPIRKERHRGELSAYLVAGF